MTLSLYANRVELAAADAVGPVGADTEMCVRREWRVDVDEADLAGIAIEKGLQYRSVLPEDQFVCRTRAVDDLEFRPRDAL